MENQKATLEPWLKEFEKRFIGYEKVSGGIGLSYVTDVDNPYLKNDISGIKDFIQETLSNREKEIAEEVDRLLPKDWAEKADKAKKEGDMYTGGFFMGMIDTVEKALSIINKHQ